MNDPRRYAPTSGPNPSDSLARFTRYDWPPSCGLAGRNPSDCVGVIVGIRTLVPHHREFAHDGMHEEGHGVGLGRAPGRLVVRIHPCEITDGPLVLNAGGGHTREIRIALTVLSSTPNENRGFIGRETRRISRLHLGHGHFDEPAVLVTVRQIMPPYR